MINFVICEDENDFAKEYKQIIDKYMMNYDYEYKCTIFNDYNEKFDSFIKTKEDFKIYILDLKTKTSSGLDAARKIREEADDWNSIILIITSLGKFKHEALAKRLMLLDFIDKSDDYRMYLIDCITKCLKCYDERPNKLKYTYKNNVYNVEFKHIVYIQKEQESKRCKIHQDDGTELPYVGTLTGLLGKLDNRFIKTSRCTIVNTRLINQFNQKNNEIYFKNGDMVNDISRENKKKVVNYVRGI